MAKKTFNEVRRLPEFEKDFKKLAKKFKTLDDDIKAFIDNQLKLTHILGIDNWALKCPRYTKQKNLPAKL